MSGSPRAAGASRGRLPELHTAVPGPASLALAERLGAVESRNVTFVAAAFPVFWERASGSEVWDADGNRYVDLTAGFGVAVAGHGHPRIVRAIREQAGRLVHGMGDVHPPTPKLRLLERLAALAPFPECRAVLGTSGSEAVEVALKTACLHTGRPGVLAFTGAYHGLGYGALAVTHRAHFRAPFRAQLNPHVLRAGYPHPYRPPARLRARLPADGCPPGDPAAVVEASLADARDRLDGPGGDRVGAVLVEPMQARGGDVVPPAGFLRGLARLCRERDLLLILDEIYTAFGRAGHRFACEAEGVVPDLLCVGKALSGSLPLSACLAPARVMDAWPPSTGEAIHTSTFLGNPVACAAALACLELLEEEGLAARASRLGAAWREALASLAERHEAVGDVRGRGLMVGIDLVRDRESREPDGARAGRVVAEALRRGWILLAGGPEGNVLSLSPPLTIEERLLEEAARMLDEALAETASRG